MSTLARPFAARIGCLAVVAVLALPAPTYAQMMPTLHVDQTPTYTLQLRLGPAELMLTHDEAMKAKSGEVMVSGGTMDSSASMATGSMSNATTMSSGASMGGPSSAEMMSPGMDAGMTANHHLEVHITRNDTGAVVNDISPTIRITDKATGASRDLPEVMGMYGMQMGSADFHYGQNVWLPDGTYTFTVTIGPELAHFRDLAVMADAPMAPMMMAGT